MLKFKSSIFVLWLILTTIWLWSRRVLLLGVIRHIVRILLLNRLINRLLVIIPLVLLLVLERLGLIPTRLIVRIGSLMGFRHLQISIVIVWLNLLIRVVSAFCSSSPWFLFLKVIERSQVSWVVMRVIVWQLDLCVRDDYSLFIHWFLIEILLLIFVHLATNTESADE